MKIPIIPVLLSIFLLGCQTGNTENYDIIVQNGNVINLESGAIVKQDIYILAGRIAKVGSSGNTEKIHSKKTIDATGKYILPGFWDNHVHFRGGDSLIEANKNFLKLFIANGITTVRDAGGDLTYSVLEWKKEIAEETLIGPTIFTSGPKIDGPQANWAGSLEVQDDADIFNALDSLQKIPVDFVKLYDSKISADMYLKTISEAENRGMITSGHMPFTVTLDETIGAGIDAVEHLYYVMKGCSSEEIAITEKLENGELGFWQAMPLLMGSYSDSSAQETFKLLKENNVYVVPTLHIGKVLSYLDEIDHTNDTYLEYMGDGIVETYKGRLQRALNSSEKAVEDRKKLDVLFGHLAKSLNDAGVGLLAGSDSGAFNSYTYPGISLHKEMELMVANGISPLDALKTSAYNGSNFLKKDKDYGRIEVGKISDLVLLDANPLEDIGNSEKIAFVIKGEHILDKSELKKLLDSAKIH